MGARQSAEVKRALELVMRHGMSPYKAAEVAGCTRAAIYNSTDPDYLKWKEQKANEKTTNRGR